MNVNFLKMLFWTVVGENDIIRQEKLETLGVKFIRFNDKFVKKDMDGVLRLLKIKIDELNIPLNPP